MTRPRIVLDTCICLDVFVFEAPQCRALMAALAQRRVDAVTNAACRDEWLRVLAYPKLGLGDQRRAQLAAEYDALVTLMCESDLQPPSDRALPRCDDADDQKFWSSHATRTRPRW